MPKQKNLSFGTFGCAVLFFFLPFVQLSCMGQGVAKLSGVQLATGTTLEQNDAFGHKQSKKLDGSPVAFLALACAVTGLGLSLTKAKPGAVVRAILGAVGVGLLLLLKSQIANESASQGQGLITLTFESGFYLALLALVAAVAVNLYAVRQGQGAALLAGPASSASRCGHCGQPLARGARFCVHCGAQAEESAPPIEQVG